MKENKETCQWPECHENGQYPAPKSPQNTKERYLFCLEHVRKYNKSWNFFDGMNRDEIEGFQKDAVSGHRHTDPMGIKGRKVTEDDIRRKVFNEFGFDFGHKREYVAKKIVPVKQKDALAILGLSYPSAISEVKKQYKKLAKKHHPDVAGSKGEEQIKKINEAYSFLKKDLAETLNQ